MVHNLRSCWPAANLPTGGPPAPQRYGAVWPWVRRANYVLGDRRGVDPCSLTSGLGSSRTSCRWRGFNPSRSRGQDGVLLPPRFFFPRTLMPARGVLWSASLFLTLCATCSWCQDAVHSQASVGARLRRCAQGCGAQLPAGRPHRLRRNRAVGDPPF